jgi:glycine cleavage system H protein
MTAKFPSDLKYTFDHVWVKVEGQCASIGVTNFASDQLGDVIVVELPYEGDDATSGEVIGSIESVKAVADLFTPISGIVVAINRELNEAPSSVNEDPYGDGWLLQIEMSDPEELSELMDSDQYAGYVAEQ